MQIQTRTPFDGDTLILPEAVGGLVGQRVKMTQGGDWSKPLLGTAEVLAAEMDGTDLLLTLDVAANPDLPDDLQAIFKDTSRTGAYRVAGQIPAGIGYYNTIRLMECTIRPDLTPAGVTPPDGSPAAPE
jgi:hypothetical protein